MPKYMDITSLVQYIITPLCIVLHNNLLHMHYNLVPARKPTAMAVGYQYHDSQRSGHCSHIHGHSMLHESFNVIVNQSAVSMLIN